jgi:hypothetical protein
MYYRNADHSAYGVKLAPMGAPDTTPPTIPQNVFSQPISDRQIDITWDPATDQETGIVQYKVFRNGLHLGTVKGWTFSDTGLTEKTHYSYEVSAVNYHGGEGPRSAPVTGTTLADTSPPGVVSVIASNIADQVTIAFDEQVEETTAELVANYAISNSVEVLGASLGPDFKTVNLTTSEHTSGTYEITIAHVPDQAEMANSMVSATNFRYLYTGVTGLVGAWTFDEGKGNTAFDLSNHGNDGQLVYTEQPGPTWAAGKAGGALHFDGIDDQVTINAAGPLENATDHSYTLVAWVNPGSVPPNTTANDSSYSILVRKRTGLFYDHDQRFRAMIRLKDGADVAVSSDVIPPGMWHHLVMVADDVNKRLHLYTDGQEASNSPVSYAGGLADHEDAPYYIGTSEPLTERYEYRFRGKIDEPRIYDRALSPAEVERLHAWFPNEPVFFAPAYLVP